MKKTIILSLIFVLLTSCSSQNDTEEEPIDLSWYVNFSWFRQPWGDDYVSKEISEKLNIKIEYISPNISEAEYMQSMINTKNLPDIITLGWWDDAIPRLIGDDLVHPLGRLSSQIYPDYLKLVDPDIQEFFSRGYDDFYLYPNSSYTYKNYIDSEEYHSNQSFIVRKDIYEAIGSPDMSTQESFKEALNLLDEYVEKNGMSEIIPIGFHEFSEYGNDSLTEHLQNFLAVPVEENGEFVDRFTNKDYISWLKFFRELYQAGYINDEVFIDQRVQIEEKIEDGRYFSMIFQNSDLKEQQKQRYLKNPDSIYIAIDGPKNENLDDHELPGTGIQGWTVTLINKNAENPKKILELFTYLLSEEGQKLISLGVENQEYIDDRTEIKFTEESLDLWLKDYDRYRSVYGGDNTHWMMQNGVTQEQWPDRKDLQFSQLKEWSKKYTVYGSLHYARLDTDSKLKGNQRKIEQLWSKTIVDLITADTEEDFEIIFNEFLKTRDSFDYKLIKDEMSNVIKEMKESLGMNNETLE